MTKEMQPEALRLAEFFESMKKSSHRWYDGTPVHEKAAAELRRLHACVQELKKELATERCLSFRAQVEQLEAQLAAQRKPLTDEQAKKIGEEARRAVLDELEDNLTVAVVRRTERAHGIGEAA